MARRWILLLSTVFLMTTGAALAQQTTGVLKGYAKDAQGLALPGVLVTVTSPNLMGAHTALTDHEGLYRFPNLPPGLYRVEATLPGFAPFVRSNARVEVGTTTTVDVTLAVAQLAEEVIVSAAAPVVDLERVERAFNVNQSAISVLPIAPRLAYQSLWQALPGVTGGQSDYLSNEFGDPLVNAGFRANESGQQGTRNQNDAYENNIFIDGMDANDPMSGRSATSLNYEAIEEVNIKTAGFEAEFGSSRSAQMQVVTKSGGNVLSGTALTQLQPEGWNWSNVTGGSSQKLSYYNPAVTVGGPIRRDRLWFFGSWKYDWENLTYADTQVVSKLNRERRGNLWYGKVTAQFNSENRLGVAVGYDRIDIWNTGESRYSTTDALTVQHRGGPLVSGLWTSAFSPSTLLQVTVGYNSKPSNNDGQGDGPRLRYHDAYRGNIVRYEQNDYRDYVSERESIYIYPNLTWYPNRELLGRHELKVGLEARPYQNITRGYIYNVDEHNFYEYYYGLDYARYGLTKPYLYEVREVFPVGPISKVKVANYAAYLQDRWHPTSQLTISAGLRWEKSKHRTLGRGSLPASLEVFDKNIRSEIEVDDTAFAPRLGAAYNLGDRAGVLRVSAGRFHERIGTGDYNNYPEGQGFNTWRVPTTSFGAGIEALTLFTSGTIPVNPDFNRDMKMEYNDEVTLGYERRLPWDLALDTTYIWRKINVSESRDANVIFYPNGTFARIDPNFDRANYREFLTGDDRIRDVSFQSIQVAVRRNFTRRSGVMASYSRYWTKEDYRRFDPTETFQFAYASPDAMDRTNYGPRWNYKVSAYYMFPKGFSASGFFNAYSGDWVNDVTGDYAWNADAPRIRLPNGRLVADIIWQARNSYFVGKDYGASGRYTDDVYNLNLRIAKEFTLRGDRLELSVDAFNLFNWAAYTGFLSSDVRRQDRYPVETNPQRPRAMQANVRYVF